MNVALFVTCLADHYFADAAADTVRLLRHLGCTVTFPDAQTCCGQPAYNAGRNAEALRMARHTADVFADAEAVVVPSGSCATMVKKFYADLMREPARRSGPAASRGNNRGTHATALPERTWELGEFIVHRLGVKELGDGLVGRRVAIHQGCHALRELRLESEPAVLLEGAGAEVVPWEAQDECCGFGGLFSVKMSAVSAAMADRKLDTLPPVDWVVSGDGGCILHLDGRSRARRLGTEFVHLATALWRGISRGAGTSDDGRLADSAPASAGRRGNATATS